MAIQSLTTTNTDVIADGGSLRTMRSKVSENGAARIASMVVNMYADPVSAVTREYIANAVDATIAAGSTKPVEVTVPTLMSPVLVVKDYGTGMDATALENAFLAFAESTKGDTNDQVGGLGVGAKSAWTLCESFMVDTVKDGKRNAVRASRDLEHEVLVSDMSTDLPNGTTISIPVNADETDWRAEILKVATFHKGGAVLVDGAAVDSVQDGKWIGPVRIGKVSAASSTYSVLSGGTMFGVPTALANIIRDYLNGVSAVIELPVGSFNHTPNRDFLIADDRTRGALTKALEKYFKAHDAILKRLVRKAKADISAAITARAGYLNGERARKILPLPYSVNLSSPWTYVGSRSGSRAAVWHVVANSSRYTLPAHELSASLARTVIITGVPEGKVLKGIGRYMDSVHFTAGMVIAIPEGQDHVSFDITPSSEDNSSLKVNAKTPGVKSVTYADVMALSKELAAQYATKRPKPAQLQYDVLMYMDGKVSTGGYTLDEISKMSEERGADVVIGDFTYHRTMVRVAPARNFIIIDNGRRSVKPIVEKFPKSTSEQEYRRAAVKAAEDAISDDDVTRFVLSDRQSPRFRAFSVVAETVSRSEGVPAHVVAAVKTLVEARRVDTSVEVSEAVHATLSASSWSHRSDRVSALTTTLEAEWRYLAKSYPLLESISLSFLTGNPYCDGAAEVFNDERLLHISRYVSSVTPVAVADSI